MMNRFMLSLALGLLLVAGMASAALAQKGAGKAALYNNPAFDCPNGATPSGPTYGFAVMNTNNSGDLIVEVAVKGGTPSATYDIWVNQDPGACPLAAPTAPSALATNAQGNGNAHVKVARLAGANTFWVSAVGGGQVLRSTAAQLD